MYIDYSKHTVLASPKNMYDSTGLSVWDLKDYFLEKGFKQDYEQIDDLRNYGWFSCQNRDFAVSLAFGLYSFYEKDVYYALWFGLTKDFCKWSNSRRHILFLENKNDLDLCYESLLISEKILQKSYLSNTDLVSCYKLSENPMVLNRLKRSARKTFFKLKT